ncbi:MAG: YraN family protein [Thiohalomonadales bacterium]
MTQGSTTQQGLDAESRVLNFLQKKGLHLIERNFRCKLGEIDLIMRHQRDVAFVEVRMRNNTSFGHAVETITRNKQLKIIRAASYYLQLNPRFAQMGCRFDVVSVTKRMDHGENFDWIEDAFQTTAWV